MTSTLQNSFSTVIERELATLTDSGPLGDAARTLVLAPGAKRARPWLVRTFGEAAGVHTTEALIDAAVAVELIHSASLLHDDVVDQAELRRGRPTANARLGNTLAVLSGDWVLTCALERLARRPMLLRPAIEAVAQMTKAIAAEVAARGDATLTLAAWTDIARGKTGALFALCGRLVGLIARDEDRAEAFAQAGMHLGVAFQLADDLADLFGLDGKGRFNDLSNASPSYPLLWAAARDPSLAADLRTLWSSSSSCAELDVEQLGARVLTLGAADATATAAQREVEQARLALGADATRPSLVTLLGWAEALVGSVRRAAR